MQSTRHSRTSFSWSKKNFSETWDCARIRYAIKSILSYEGGRNPVLFYAVKGQPVGLFISRHKVLMLSLLSMVLFLPLTRKHHQRVFAVFPAGTRDFGGGGAAKRICWQLLLERGLLTLIAAQGLRGSALAEPSLECGAFNRRKVVR